MIAITRGARISGHNILPCRFEDVLSGTKEPGLRANQRPGAYYVCEALKNKRVLGVFVGCASRWARGLELTIVLSREINLAKKNFVSVTEPHLYFIVFL
jgi:hypothetical protein